MSRWRWALALTLALALVVVVSPGAAASEGGSWSRSAFTATFAGWTHHERLGLRAKVVQLPGTMCRVTALRLWTDVRDGDNDRTDDFNRSPAVTVWRLSVRSEDGSRVRWRRGVSRIYPRRHGDGAWVARTYDIPDQRVAGVSVWARVHVHLWGRPDPATRNIHLHFGC